MPKLSVVKVATILTARIAAVLPTPFTVSTEEGTIRFANPAAGWTAETLVKGVLLNDDEDFESVSTVAWNTLSTAQDYIAEVTHEPWPASPGKAGGDAIPLPFARIDGPILQLGYSEGDSIVLELPSINLDDLTNGLS